MVKIRRAVSINKRKRNSPFTDLEKVSTVQIPEASEQTTVYKALCVVIDH